MDCVAENTQAFKHQTNSVTPEIPFSSVLQTRTCVNPSSYSAWKQVSWPCSFDLRYKQSDRLLDAQGRAGIAAVPIQVKKWQHLHPLKVHRTVRIGISGKKSCRVKVPWCAIGSASTKSGCDWFSLQLSPQPARPAMEWSRDVHEDQPDRISHSLFSVLVWNRR